MYFLLVKSSGPHSDLVVLSRPVFTVQCFKTCSNVLHAPFSLSTSLPLSLLLPLLLLSLVLTHSVALHVFFELFFCNHSFSLSLSHYSHFRSLQLLSTSPLPILFPSPILCGYYFFFFIHVIFCLWFLSFFCSISYSLLLILTLFPGL